MRKEHDFLGAVEIPDDALYGIHSTRAREISPTPPLSTKNGSARWGW
jgi:aspartate ammonia-lyase